MSTTQLFIPDKIHIGFQKREGTFTGKLAYIVYTDQKGVLRKEKSWNSWRDKKITPKEFQNEPIEGFVLNKGVGGTRESYGWNTRNEYIRVYDPRGFEFEISVANLLFILRECDCSKGKGLEGKFCYAWDGTELVLLPVISEDYQKSKDYTSLQSGKVSAKSLVPGHTYITKKQEKWIYLGKLDKFVHSKGYKQEPGVFKLHVFWDGNGFEFAKDTKQLAGVHNDSETPDFAYLMDKYLKSVHGSKIVKLFARESTKKMIGSYDHYRNWIVPEGHRFLEFQMYKWHRDQQESLRYYDLSQAGVLIQESHRAYRHPDDRYGTRNKDKKWVEPTNLQLFALMESGSEFRVSDGYLYEERDEEIEEEIEEEVDNGEDD